MTQQAVVPAYSPGLEGIIAGESAIGLVDSNTGLFYRGYDVHELAKQATFEHVAYLLLHGELPATNQLASFRRELTASRALPAAVIAMLNVQPGTASLMDVLRTGVSMLGAFDPELNDLSHDANVRKSTRLLARMGTLAATARRVMDGGEAIQPDRLAVEFRPGSAGGDFAHSNAGPQEIAAQAVAEMADRGLYQPGS